MRLRIIFSSVAVITVVTSSAFAEQAPISLTPKGEQPREYPQNTQTGHTGHRANQRLQSALTAEQRAGAYRFPATRAELEQAANDCQKQVQALYSERSQVERYRLPEFQRSIGEAQRRCRNLVKLAETIKLADEQLYSYQQSLGQAERAFSAG
ncbi:MAG: hypothetical protein ABFQ95_07070 [Pseudomonadota bacterium]